MSVSLAVSGVTYSHSPKPCSATSTAKRANTNPPNSHGAPRRRGFELSCKLSSLSARSDITGLRVYHAPRRERRRVLWADRLANMTPLDIFLNQHDRLRSGWRLALFWALNHAVVVALVTVVYALAF